MRSLLMTLKIVIKMMTQLKKILLCIYISINNMILFNAICKNTSINLKLLWKLSIG